jgi:hypothetical protein
MGKRSQGPSITKREAATGILVFCLGLLGFILLIAIEM